MVGANLGPDYDLAKRISDLEILVRGLSTRDVLQNASIGAGGITVNGGSIIVTGTGSIQLATGTFFANAVTGNSVSSPLVVGTVVKTTSGPSTNITAARVAAWLQNSDGLIGMATSSMFGKTRLRPADIAERASQILQITVGYFEYIDEVRRRDDPSFADYVGPEYHVGVNLGALAQQLHDLGLWEWVVYERHAIYETREDEDGDKTEVVVGDELTLDASGQPIPIAIHDILIGWAALILAQYQGERLTAIESWAATQGFEAQGSR